jgi:uncharacterized protein YdeI (YjbR/CyaY-like superfamily)
VAVTSPTFFATPAAFRAWLRKHHTTEKELIVGFYKKASGKPSMTWPEAVDEALCYGWIDGVRRKHGEDAYTNRFTPRRPTSNWSAVNIAKVSELTRQKRMQPAGLAAFARRQEHKSRVYTYENRHEAAFEPSHEKRFRANRKAWAFFATQPPSYRKLMIVWIESAKQEETRLRRLDGLIAACQKQERLL